MSKALIVPRRMTLEITDMIWRTVMTAKSNLLTPVGVRLGDHEYQAWIDFIYDNPESTVANTSHIGAEFAGLPVKRMKARGVAVIT